MNEPPARPFLSWGRLAALNALAFSLGFVVNTLEPALLGSRALELAPETKNTVVGLLTFAGLIVAVIWQPVAGDLSDRTSSSWGRRAPVFLAGGALLIAALFLVAAAPTLTWLLVSVLLVQFAANTVQAPSQALLPDHVPLGQRGAASGWKAALEILAFVAGRQVSARLVADGLTLQAAGAAGLVVALGAGVVLLAARERRGPERSGRAPSGIRQLLRLEGTDAPGFRMWMVNRALVWGGFIALSTFLLFFVIDVLGLDEPQAQRFVGDLSTVMGLGLILVAVPAGRWADRWGRRRLIAASGLLAAVGTALLLAVPSREAALMAGAILGLAVGVFQASSWALATQLVPAMHAARMLGLANIATAAGSGLARLGGGLIIDPVNRMTGSQSSGYFLLYGLAGAAFLAGTLAILRAPDSESSSQG